jgi:hypothetical protein
MFNPAADVAAAVRALFQEACLFDHQYAARVAERGRHLRAHQVTQRSMIRGGWNYRLPPPPGELLSSCLARNAHALGCTPYRFLNMFWEGDPVWNRDFDRDPAGLSRAGRRPHVPD